MNIRGAYRARMLVRRLRSRLTHEAVILLYHRIADVASDPWSLSVTPGHFAHHLEIIAKTGHATRLTELPRELRRRRTTRRSIVITFDDGYLDNLHDAKPLLERWDIPATIFVATGTVNQPREFWWDDLERLVLLPDTLPESLHLFANGTWHYWSLKPTQADTRPDRDLNTDWQKSQAHAELRASLFRSIYELLCPLSPAERARVLDDLRAWARAEPNGQHAQRPLNAEEVQLMARCELIEIGAHTVDHSRLAGLPAHLQRAEIEGSKAVLEQAIDRPVSSFAYPFGKRSDYTADTVALVRAAGFARACCNFPGAVRRTTDRYQLPRFHVLNWDGDEFSRRLSAWFEGAY